jgi:EPS-associated MarR family transcriptional regulator
MNGVGSPNQSAPVSTTRDELRLRVMRLLEKHPEMSQRAIARELGVSLGGVNYALKALIDRRYVKAGNFVRSENKSAYVYILTPAGLAQKSVLATIFLSRKLEEFEILRQEIEALRLEVGFSEEAGS